MSDIDFREHVVASLAELKTDMKNVVARLDKLNGTVARHEQEFGTLRLQAEERRNELLHQLDEKLAPLQEFMTVTRTQASTASRIVSAAKPAIWTGVGMLAIVVLQNWPFLSRFFD